MNEKDLVEVGKQAAKRGRPKGSGGNTRKDLSWSGNANLQSGDNTKFIRHARESLDLPPLNINDPKQVRDRIEWFFDHCEQDDMKPTVTGLCNALGIDRKTFYCWGAGTRRETKTSEYADLVKKARAIMEELWEDYLVHGKVNPITGIFLGKNHFGYTDKQEIVVTPNTPLGDVEDTKALEDKYIDSVAEEV